MTLVASLLAVFALGQAEPPPVTWPAVPRQAKSVQALVPARWTIERQLAIDFDRDGRDDVLLVLKMNEPANVLTGEGFGQTPFDTNPRMLVAALATKKGLRTVLVDHELIPRNEKRDFEDPWGGVEARKNGFSVGLSSFASVGTWWTSGVTLTFRYESGCFRLIGYDSSTNHRASGEGGTRSVNLLTGESEEERRALNLDSGLVETTRSRDRGAPRRVCLEELGNGLLFTP